MQEKDVHRERLLQRVQLYGETPKKDHRSVFSQGHLRLGHHGVRETR